MIAALRAGRFADLGWRGERIPDDALARLRTATLAGPEDGAVLLWWLRNSHLFSLGLDRDPRVLVIRYEDLVGDPAPVLERAFGHLGLGVPPGAVAGIRTSRRQPADLAGVADDVAALADEMTARLAGATAALDHG